MKKKVFLFNPMTEQGNPFIGGRPVLSAKSGICIIAFTCYLCTITDN